MKFNAVLVSLILFSLTAGAKDFCSKQIELSKKHLLEKHRIKMAKALNKAIESKACVSRKKELKEKLVNYLEIFISDESQQMYEKAKVSSQKEPSQSIELLKRLLKKKSKI